jgi:hypothetical protein
MYSERKLPVFLSGYYIRRRHYNINMKWKRLGMAKNKKQDEEKSKTYYRNAEMAEGRV